MEENVSSQYTWETFKIFKVAQPPVFLVFKNLPGSLCLQHVLYPDFTLSLLIVIDLRKLLGIKNL